MAGKKGEAGGHSLLGYMMRGLTSTVGLFFINMTYLLLGAWLFLAIEAPREASLKNNLEEERDSLVDSILTLGAGPEEYYRGNASAKLAFYEQQLANFYRKRATFEISSSNDSLSNLRLWSYEGAIIYCYSVITTIGWGNIVPNTVNGKLGTVIYGLNGMPLFFSLSSEVGTLCSKVIFAVWNSFRNTVLPLIRRKPIGEKNKSGSKSISRSVKDNGARRDNGRRPTTTSGHSSIATRCSTTAPAPADHGRTILVDTTSTVLLSDSTSFYPKPTRYKPTRGFSEGWRLLHRSRNSVYLKNARSCVDYMLYAHSQLHNRRALEDLPHFRIQSKKDAMLLSCQFSRMSTDELIRCMEYAGFDYAMDVLGRSSQPMDVLGRSSQPNLGQRDLAGDATRAAYSRVTPIVSRTLVPAEGASRTVLSSSALLHQGAHSWDTSCVINLDTAVLRPGKMTQMSHELTHTLSSNLLTQSQPCTMSGYQQPDTMFGYQQPDTMSVYQQPDTMSGYQQPDTMSVYQQPDTMSVYQLPTKNYRQSRKQNFSCVKRVRNTGSWVHNIDRMAGNVDKSKANIDTSMSRTNIDTSTANTDASTANIDTRQHSCSQRALAGRIAGVHMFTPNSAPDDGASWSGITRGVATPAIAVQQISQCATIQSQTLGETQLTERQEISPSLQHRTNNTTTTSTTLSVADTKPGFESVSRASYWPGWSRDAQTREVAGGAELCLPASPNQQCRFTENRASCSTQLTSLSVHLAEAARDSTLRLAPSRGCMSDGLDRPSVRCLHALRDGHSQPDYACTQHAHTQCTQHADTQHAHTQCTQHADTQCTQHAHTQCTQHAHTQCTQHAHTQCTQHADTQCTQHTDTQRRRPHMDQSANEEHVACDGLGTFQHYIMTAMCPGAHNMKQFSVEARETNIHRESSLIHMHRVVTTNTPCQLQKQQLLLQQQLQQPQQLATIYGTSRHSYKQTPCKPAEHQRTKRDQVYQQQPAERWGLRGLPEMQICFLEDGQAGCAPRHVKYINNGDKDTTADPQLSQWLVEDTTRGSARTHVKPERMISTDDKYSTIVDHHLPQQPGQDCRAIQDGNQAWPHPDYTTHNLNENLTESHETASLMCRQQAVNSGIRQEQLETRLARSAIVDRFLSVTDAAKDKTSVQQRQIRFSCSGNRRTGTGQLSSACTDSIDASHSIHIGTNQIRDDTHLGRTPRHTCAQTTQVQHANQDTSGHLASQCVRQVAPGHLASQCVRQVAPGHLASQCVRQVAPGHLASQCVRQVAPGHLASQCVRHQSLGTVGQRSNNRFHGQDHKNGNVNENHDRKPDDDEEDSDDICTVYSFGRMKDPEEDENDDEDDGDIEFVSGRGMGFVWTDIPDWQEDTDAHEQGTDGEDEDADDDDDDDDEEEEEKSKPIIDYARLGVELAALDLSGELTQGGAGQGNQQQRFHVPLFVMYILVIVYVLVGSVVFFYWDQQLEFWDCIYFIYVMLSTTGFGDLLPKPYMYSFIVVYALVGMALYNIMINATLELFIEVLEYLATIGDSSKTKRP